MNRETLLSQVSELVKAKLKPLVDEIDRNGLYPEDFMRELGAIGGFGAVGTEAGRWQRLGFGDANRRLARSRQRMRRDLVQRMVSRRLARGICTRRLNQAVKDKYLADILQGKVIGGYGRCPIPSNTSPALKNTTFAERVDGGYKVNGALPGIQHRRRPHLGKYRPNRRRLRHVHHRRTMEGVTLQASFRISCPRSTRTFSLNFKDVFIPTKT